MEVFEVFVFELDFFDLFFFEEDEVEVANHQAMMGYWVEEAEGSKDVYISGRKAP